MSAAAELVDHIVVGPHDRLVVNIPATTDMMMAKGIADRLREIGLIDRSLVIFGTVTLGVVTDNGEDA